MRLKRTEKKKLLGVITRLQNGCLITFKKIHKQPPEAFYKEAVLLKTSQYSQDEQENICVEVSF